MSQTELFKELQRLNPVAKLEQCDNTGTIRSSVKIENLVLPEPFFYNEKNGINNKHTGPGIYTAVGFKHEPEMDIDQRARDLVKTLFISPSTPSRQGTIPKDVITKWRSERGINRDLTSQAQAAQASGDMTELDRLRAQKAKLEQELEIVNLKKEIALLESQKRDAVRESKRIKNESDYEDNEFIIEDMATRNQQQGDLQTQESIKSSLDNEKKRNSLIQKSEEKVLSKWSTKRKLHKMTKRQTRETLAYAVGERGKSDQFDIHKQEFKKLIARAELDPDVHFATLWQLKDDKELMRQYMLKAIMHQNTLSSGVDNLRQLVDNEVESEKGDDR